MEWFKTIIVGEIIPDVFVFSIQNHKKYENSVQEEYF